MQQNACANRFPRLTNDRLHREDRENGCIVSGDCGIGHKSVKIRLLENKMFLEALLTTYGYPAIFVGTFLEGETIVVIAGILAHRGYLSLPMVILMSFLGSFAGDHLFFHLGRMGKIGILQRKKGGQSNVNKVRTILERHRIPLVLGFRFVYGFRTITPFVIGMSGFTRAAFIFLNGIGAMLWAIVIGMGGYIFGQVLESFLADMKRYEWWIALGIALAGGMLLIYHTKSGKLQNNQHKT